MRCRCVASAEATAPGPGSTPPKRSMLVASTSVMAPACPAGGAGAQMPASTLGWRCVRGLQVKIGVLALQGAFATQAAVLRALGAEAREVRVPTDLDGVDALVLPGGESTTMSLLLDSSGLRAPIADGLADGLP